MISPPLSVPLNDSLIILLGAVCLDAILGDPPILWRTLPHPVACIGWAIAFLDKRLNRPRRTPTDRRVRGALVTAGLTVSAVAIGLLVGMLRREWRWGWTVELLLAWTLIAQRSLYDHVRAVASALRKDGLIGGRQAVARIVGRDVSLLDEFGVARAAIESCAESFADGVVAPVFWYALFGMPGLLAVKTVNTMDSMIGHKDPHYRDFGMAAARLDDVLNFIPARLAAIFLCLAAFFVPGGQPFRAFRTMWRDHGRHELPNAGWPESAMAGAFDLALAGPRRYGAEMTAFPWIGDGRAMTTVRDIGAALALFAVACLIEAGFLVLVVVVNR